MKENSKDNIYPRFISNKPCGIDKFEGKSQERLTNAIANHIASTDERDSQKPSRIIGLEGGWGVGKSNVIKQIKQHVSIKDKYYLFEYDAWGHQEDLQRRSFLEILTAELIENEILTGITEINIKGGETKTVSWNEKLKYLLARKAETSTEKRPKLSLGIIAFIIATIFTSIAASVADTIKTDYFTLSIILPFVPFFIAAIVLWFILRKQSKKNIFNEIFSIYSGKVESEVTYETISEEEPTVVEFKKWMQDISKHLGATSRKIIIVYDNMDRLPAEKVKELWSSIHTFFSEDGFDNVWAIIPFDETHLSCAFGESDNKKQLTKYFISKTFPVVYHVTPPIITDFKKIFNILFEEAFADTAIDQQEDINRIFRLENPAATVREMIEFINQLVALKNIWSNELDILHISIFVLKKEALFSNPVIAEQILSGDYLGQYIPNIISNGEPLQKSISALAYGISLDIAEQIPMSSYIDDCFNSEVNADINKYANSNNFIHILSDKIKNIDYAQINNVIQSLSQLDNAIFEENDKKTITLLWNNLAQRKMRITLAKQEFDKSFKPLLLNVDYNHKNYLVKYLSKQIQLFKEFKSENYYKALKELEDFLKSHKIEVNAIDCLVDLEKEPEVFVDYVLCAKNSYLLYKMKTDPEALSLYLSDRVTDKYSVLEALEYISSDGNYKFDNIKTKIEEVIQDQQLFKDGNFKPLLEAYKILSDEKPLDVQLNPTQRQAIWNTLAAKPETPEYLEILAIQIVNGTNTGGNCSDIQIKYLAETLDYYANYGELLINNLSWNIPILNQVLKFMTENRLGHTLTLEDVLPKFIEIKNKLGVQESILLEQLNDWEEHKDAITKENIYSIFQNIPQFFQFSKATKNILTDYLNSTIIEALSGISIETLYQQKQQPNYFWNVVVQNLIDTDFLKSLPDNLTEFGKKLLDDIAAGRQAIPNQTDLLQKIIDKLDKRKTKETITHIKNQICNNITGYSIDANKFLFMHEWLVIQGDLSSRAGDVCQYILTPVANNENCLKVIIQNADFYANIINSADAQADTLKNGIKSKLTKSTDEDLISFAKTINIDDEKQEK